MGKKTAQIKKTGVRARLNQAFIQVIACLSGAAVLAVIAMFVMASRYENSLQNYAFPQGDIGHCMVSFAEARSSLRGAIGYDEQAEIDKMIAAYDENKEKFTVYLAELEKTMVTPEGHAAYAAIVSSLEGYWELSDEILAQGSVTDRAICAQAQDRAVKELAPKFAAVEQALEDLMSVNVIKGDDTYALMQVIKVVLLVAMIIIIVLAVMIAMRLGNGIAKGIETPLAQLSKRLGEFAHGDLGSPFPVVETKDEIADIVNECRDMAENLNTIITDAGELLSDMADGNFAIATKCEEKYEGKFRELLMSMRNLNRQLDGTLRQINESSDQVTTGSGQLAESAQDLAEGATDQAGAVEELTATVEGVTGIAVESAENATRAAERVRQAVQNADRSRQDMNQLTDAMNRIMETSKEIENIIAAIEDIASQTNLLSLNASIEAARAGEAGRGFAVVADQIGKLASDSAQSAVTTKELISKSLEEIARGNMIAENSIRAIGEVLANMEEFAGVASGSAEASNTQAEMLKQIEAGIEQISSVVQNNSASAEETSAISQELSAQATSLKEMVAAFTLRS